jgi:hypothetical protein
MHYIILIYGDEKNFAMMSEEPKAKEEIYAAFMRYGADMQAAGVLRGGAELKPTHSATTVESGTAGRSPPTGRSPRPRSSSAATT